MLQMIRHLYPEVRATFELINRSKAVRIADEIDGRAAGAAWAMRGRSALPRRS